MMEMEIRKSQFDFGYFLFSDEFYDYNDLPHVNKVARYFNIDKNEMLEVFKKYGAEYNGNIGVYYFPTHERVRELLDSDELLSYVMMRELVE